jgi:hypothetical protein
MSPHLRIFDKLSELLAEPRNRLIDSNHQEATKYTMSRQRKIRPSGKSSLKNAERRGPTKQRPKIPLAKLPERSLAARDRSLHVVAAMRRDPQLSLVHAAKLQRVKVETVKKYIPGAFERVKGKFRATKIDRYTATLYVPDSYGHSVLVKTHSSKDREALGRYLRDLGRFLRGKRDALAPWHGKRIAGIELVTSSRVLVAIEPALSELSLYRAFNGGAA